MKIILVYDVGEKRVQKVLKTCRKYLKWVQNSVFEGEITQANLEKLKLELQNIINKDEDSIIIYIFKINWYNSREIIGLDKNKQDMFL
ncbi:MAG: CRISPR-associated endonuclease Cas2 [Candidatus Calescibacterium sp.]|nr:CRISPR-associated endonuclease Cas2 [Candidatus Calescibacterium sp.]MDW8133317.1 CRISPR-associated endonuclease Cas2 [Candidatus Calescibacterium sp.]